jgi:hypothetical protein
MSESRTEFAESFYEEVEQIRLKDPLAEFLGAVEKDKPLVYGFKEAVLTAGHSCPAVAGAFKLTSIALKTLFGDELPLRGSIRVLIKGGVDQLAYGPQSQVITLITGAAAEAGFKGLGNRFTRKGLLSFDKENFEFNTFIFARVDTGKAVKIIYNPQAVAEDPRLAGIMPTVLSGEATEDEEELFKSLWQDKIRKILLETEDYPELFEVEELEDFEFPIAGEGN